HLLPETCAADTAGNAFDERRPVPEGGSEHREEAQAHQRGKQKESELLAFCEGEEGGASDKRVLCGEGPERLVPEGAADKKREGEADQHDGCGEARPPVLEQSAQREGVADQNGDRGDAQRAGQAHSSHRTTLPEGVVWSSSTNVNSRGIL